MDLNQHTQPNQLERYSFQWSQVRLLIAALALLLGGVPPVYFLIRVPALWGAISVLLKLAWIVSGVAAAYLLYRWNANKQVLFGGKVQMDTVAFFVSVISGLNLGLAGLLSRNIGMSLLSNRAVFVIVAVLYLAAAWHLWQRWNASGKKMF